MLALLLACGGGADCREAAVQSWDNFGQGFVTQNCQACHASTAEQRQGAPESIVFDTEADFLAHHEAIERRVLEAQDMPPQGGITDDDRQRLRIYLECP